MPTRRDFFGRLFAGGLLAPPALTNDWLGIVETAARFADRRTAQEVAQDEDFWQEIHRAFTVDRTIINLNNGGVCPSPRVVQEAMARYLMISNEATAYSMWQLVEPQIESVRQQLARAFGCDPEEMAITRNASESLETVQLGMHLEPGDEVLTTNQDYGRMLTTWDQRARREGITVRKISFPVPAPTMEDLVRRFEQAIGPRTKVIHCCHVTNLTGQIFPIREIVHMARARGIEVIVDGAHAFAHFPFQHSDLDCDYYGTSLHKWLLAPVGTGFLYVRREKIRDIWPLMAAPQGMDDNIRKFEEIGTHPAANHNAIAEALAFHEGIGGERKIERLRYLRDRWMRRLEGQPRVQLLTAFERGMAGGLATVGIEGIEPAAIADWLWRNRRVFVVPIVHAEYKGIRVTPNVYTRVQEIDVFAESMEHILANGVN